MLLHVEAWCCQCSVLDIKRDPPTVKGGENHNSGLELALQQLAAKREAEGMFSCSTGLQLQRRPVLLSVLISKGTCLPWQNMSLPYSVYSKQ